MNEVLKGHVVALISETQVALDIGDEAGVEIGMRFAILRPEPEEIRVPGGDEVLDTLLVARTVVKVVHVRPKISVAQTFRVSKSSSIFSAFAVADKSRPETLRSDSKFVASQLAERDSKVKIGDPVIQYTEGDFPGIVADF